MNLNPASDETIATVITLLLGTALVFLIIGHTDEIIVPLMVLLGWLISELVTYMRSKQYEM